MPRTTIARLSVSGIGELERKLSRLLPEANKLVSDVIVSGARVFGESIYNSAPISPSGVRSGANQHARGELKHSVKRGQLGKKRVDNIQNAFAAVDRKEAPQARWLYSGTKRQAPRKQFFDNAVSSARNAARTTVREGLIELGKKLNDV